MYNARRRYQPANGGGAGLGMVQYKRRRYPSKYARRGRYPMYRKAGSFAAQVRKVVAAEVKFHYVKSLIDAEISGTSIAFLSAIIQGVGQSQRIGNWIRPTSMHGTVVCKGNPEALALPTPVETYLMRVTILVFNDDLAVAEPVSASNFLLDSARPGGPFNINIKGQFSVLWTRVVTVSNNTDNTQFVRTLTFRINTTKQRKCLFKGPDGDDFGKFQYLFLASSEAPSPVNEPPTADIDSMFRYTDS